MNSIWESYKQIKSYNYFDNHEKHEKFRIPNENHEIHDSHRISFDSK